MKVVLLALISVNSWCMDNDFNPLLNPLSIFLEEPEYDELSLEALAHAQSTPCPMEDASLTLACPVLKCDFIKCNDIEENDNGCALAHHRLIDGMRKHLNNSHDGLFLEDLRNYAERHLKICPEGNTMLPIQPIFISDNQNYPELSPDDDPSDGHDNFYFYCPWCNKEYYHLIQSSAYTTELLTKDVCGHLIEHGITETHHILKVIKLNSWISKK